MYSSSSRKALTGITNIRNSANSTASKKKLSAMIFYQPKVETQNESVSNKIVSCSNIRNTQQQIATNGNIQSKKNQIMPNNIINTSNSQSLFSQADSLTQNTSYCLNHRSAIAEYISRTFDGQQILYCEQCATLLVDQGFEVYSITGDNQPEHHISILDNPKQNYQYYQARYPQIQRLQQLLSSTLSDTNIKAQQLKQILIESQQFYGSQIQEITHYFEEVIQQIQLQKNKCYNYILKQRAQAQNQARNMLKKALLFENTLKEIKIDIQDNIDQVYTVEQNNYQMVMNSFQEKIQQICEELYEKNGGMIVKDVEFRKIDFVGIPDSINSLSEIVLKSLGEESLGSYCDEKNKGDILGSMRLSNPIKDYNQQFSNNENSNIMNRNNISSSLMFSFDGQKMKGYMENQPSNYNNQNKQMMGPLKNLHNLNNNNILRSQQQSEQEEQYHISGVRQVRLSDNIASEQEIQNSRFLYCEE